MEYRKPELAVLGDAAVAIQSSKPGSLDSTDTANRIPIDECTQD